MQLRQIGESCMVHWKLCNLMCVIFWAIHAGVAEVKYFNVSPLCSQRLVTHDYLYEVKPLDGFAKVEWKYISTVALIHVSFFFFFFTIVWLYVHFYLSCFNSKFDINWSDLTQSASIKIIILLKKKSCTLAQCYSIQELIFLFFIALKYTIAAHKPPGDWVLKRLFGRLLSLSWYLPIILNLLIFINYNKRLSLCWTRWQ